MRAARIWHPCQMVFLKHPKSELPPWLLSHSSFFMKKAVRLGSVGIKWMASVVAYDHYEFEKVSNNKSAEMLIEESQKDAENYEDKADHSIKANDKEIKEADMLLATGCWEISRVLK